MDSHLSIVDHYRKVFNSSSGRIVLADILNSLGMFDYTQIESDNLALQNKGKEILVKCGILSKGSIPEIIDALFEVPTYEGEHNGEQI